MADGSHPAFNDKAYDLWKKIAWNLYVRATNYGMTGFNPPSINDRQFDLKKKSTYYSARIAEYLHP